MRKNPSYTALLRPTRLLISEKSATYTFKWSYTIIWQVRVQELGGENQPIQGKAKRCNEVGFFDEKIDDFAGRNWRGKRCPLSCSYVLFKKFSRIAYFCWGFRQVFVAFLENLNCTSTENPINSSLAIAFLIASILARNP